jgi:hypothetical protein
MKHGQGAEQTSVQRGWQPPEGGRRSIRESTFCGGKKLEKGHALVLSRATRGGRRRGRASLVQDALGVGVVLGEDGAATDRNAGEVGRGNFKFAAPHRLQHLATRTEHDDAVVTPVSDDELVNGRAPRGPPSSPTPTWRTNSPSTLNTHMRWLLPSATAT